jgi:hypothetical protein
MLKYKNVHDFKGITILRDNKLDYYELDTIQECISFIIKELKLYECSIEGLFEFIEIHNFDLESVIYIFSRCMQIADADINMYCRSLLLSDKYDPDEYDSEYDEY